MQFDSALSHIDSQHKSRKIRHKTIDYNTTYQISYYYVKNITIQYHVYPLRMVVNYYAKELIYFILTWFISMTESCLIYPINISQIIPESPPPALIVDGFLRLLLIHNRSQSNSQNHLSDPSLFTHYYIYRKM